MARLLWSPSAPTDDRSSPPTRLMPVLGTRSNSGVPPQTKTSPFENNHVHHERFSGFQTISVKSVGDLAGGQDQQLLTVQAEPHERGAGLEAQARLRVACGEVINRKLAGIVFNNHLLAAGVHRGVSAKETMTQLALFDRVDEHAIVVVVQHQPIAFGKARLDIKRALASFQQQNTNRLRRKRVVDFDNIVVVFVAHLPSTLAQREFLFKSCLARVAAKAPVKDQA